MAEIDWRVDPRSEQSMTPAPSREEMAARERELEKTRAQIGGSYFGVTGLFPTENQSSLSTIGSIAGGIAPLLFPESKIVAPIMRLTEAAPAVARPFIPSLLGSAAGTTVGTIAEQAILPDQRIFSTETGKKLLENNLENAAFDLGGNLVFTAFGKVIKAGKDQLTKAGIVPSASFFATPEQEARRAAQEWLSSRGATLTKGQLTGNIGTLEGTLKYSPASTYFDQQQKAVKEALNAGANDVRSALETSDAFKNALKETELTQMTVGDRFQNAIGEADKLMKEKFAPVYEKIDADQGLRVNLVPLKQEAQKELDKLAQRKFIGAGSDRRKVLEDIIKQDDEVTFGTAHALRSDLLASGREATKEGVPSTVLQKEYYNQAQGIANQMDNIMVLTFGNEEEKAIARKMGLIGGIDQPAGLRNGQYIGNNFASIDAMNIGRTKATTANNDLLREYFNAQSSYKNAMGGLYSGTMQAALKEEPSAVGGYLFNIDRPERMKDTVKAISEVQKYLPKEQSAGLKAELQYGYLNKIFGDPNGIATLSKNLDDKTFKEGFNYLFQEPTLRKQLLDIANATKYGLEESAGSTALRTKFIGSAITTATAGVSTLGYLNLPDEIKNKIDLPSALASYGVLYVTPKMLGRALTNKNTMDALAMIPKAQANPKYAGAMATKIADALNRSGILDEEYANDVNKFLHGAPKQESLQQAPVINWDVAPQAQPAQ
jgi:hypothetical protein